MVSGSYIWGEKPATWAHVIPLREGGISSNAGNAAAPGEFPALPGAKNAGGIIALSPVVASARRKRRRESEFPSLSLVPNMSRTSTSLVSSCHSHGLFRAPGWLSTFAVRRDRKV